MRNVFLPAILLAALSLPSAPQEKISVSSSTDYSQPRDSKILIVIFPATLCSTEMPDDMIKMFEKEYSIPVQKKNLCTGDAIDYIKNGGIADLLIGHDIDAELEFEKAGYVTNIRPVLYSNYVIVGPREDPAGIRGLADPLKALKIIARKKLPFFSRGDNSGTNALEKRMWKMAKVNPRGEWYIITQTGNDATLLLASKRKGYTIMHYATFIQEQETLNLNIMVEGNEKNKLITTYEAMALNPQKFPGTHYVDAMTFLGYITSPKIQKYIGDYGIKEFKRQTNFPLAVTGQ